MAARGVGTALSIRQEFGVIAAIGAGTFAFAFQVASVLVLLPTVNGFLGPKIAVGWIVTTYLLCLTAFLLLCGRVGDLFGNRRTYLWGLGLFTAASLACGTARWPLVLLVARCLQGMGVALASANSPALLTRQISASRYGRALGWQTTMTYLGLAVGPACAATLLPRFGWRSVFLVEAPAGIVAMALALWALRPDVRAARQTAGLPLRGTFLWIVCLVPCTLALGQGARWGWGSATVAGMLVVSSGAFLVLVATEGRSGRALVGLHLLRRADACRSILSEALFYGSLYAAGFLVPIMAMRGGRSGAALAGAMLLCQALTRMVATPLAGLLSDRLGSIRLIAAGDVVLAASTLILLVAWRRATPWMLTVLVALVGLGSSFFVPANSRRLFAATPLADHGAAAGMLATARNLGMLLGTAAAAALNATSLQVHAGGEALVANVRNTLWLVLSAAVVMLLEESVQLPLRMPGQRIRLWPSPSHAPRDFPL